MLLGSWTWMVESPWSRGRAIKRPEINCEPSFPEMSFFPGRSGPCTERGTLISPVCSFSGLRTVPNLAIISEAPLRGRPRRVPSPVMSVLEPDPGCCMAAVSGIIRRVRRPDSPTWRSFASHRSFGSRSFAALRMTVVLETVTSAPRALATLMAASLSPQGE